MQLVQSAQQAKSNAESKADTVAKYLFYAALSVGIIAFTMLTSQICIMACRRTRKSAKP